MKIKEVASLCGLTEKAIRLYENRGLITPKTEEKNGRMYREYDENCIRVLKTVGILRRADFSLDQIGEMKSSPDRIPEIFESYRKALEENGNKINLLRAAAERMEDTCFCGIDDFADRLACLMEEAEHPSEGTSETGESWDEKVTGPAALWMIIPKKLRTAIVIGSAFLLVFVLLLHCLCQTTPVSFTKEGVFYHRESGEITPVTVTFDGVLKQFVWRDDYFTGKLEFEGFSVYDVMGNSHKLGGNDLIRFYDSLKIYYEFFWADAACWSYGRKTNALIKYKNEDYRLEFTLLHIEGLENRDEFSLICPVLEPDGNNGGYWLSDTGYYLVFPAETQDDAEFAVRRMWDDYNEAYPSDMPVDE